MGVALNFIVVLWCVASLAPPRHAGLLISALLTAAAGLFLLATELIYDVAIGEMQRRHAVAK